MQPELPAPGVAFGPDFAERLQRLYARISRAVQTREGAGRAHLLGGGEEFVGYRPYRPGEDLRNLDWSLFARDDRPFVRVTRREASERWAIVLDTSASMGIGSPGKLQWGAELATGLACVGREQGAEVQLIACGAEEASAVERRGPVLRRWADLPTWIAHMEGLRAEGSDGLDAAARGVEASFGRVFLISDFFELAPDALGAFLRRGRQLFAARVLAPEELVPQPGAAVEWHDPEDRSERPVATDDRHLVDYERELEAELVAWRNRCAHHRIAHGVFSSATPFEEAVAALLAGA